MAFGKREDSYKLNGQNVQKADVILEVNSQMSAKIDALTAKVNKNSAEMEKALSKLGKGGRGANSSQIEKVYNALHEEYNSIRREITFVAAQNEHIFLELSSQIQKLTEAISGGTPLMSQNAPAQVDYNELAAKIVELLPAQEYISPDYIASKVAEQLAVSNYAPSAQTDNVKRPAPASTPVPVDLRHSDEIADRIALRLSAMKADDFNIIVDDYGCSAISDSITEKLNYEVIAETITDKLHSALSYLIEKEPDYDQISSCISQKLATSLTSPAQLPEIDTDDIADKVVNQLLGNMPAAAVDSESLCKNISEKLAAAQENNDYDIVIDEEGLNKITDYVAAEIRKSTDSRLKGIESQLSDLKTMLVGGAVMHAAVAEKVEEAFAEAETLHIDLEERTDGVDFENMMKYDRSFIARIIQSSDEQKEYYGRVKTALLSYSKVNSNVAWGAERFNKGRETIARFKIRGKTLCLYLALNPQDYEYSVYHHQDVSDNKSMRSTPMMVKIKSPRGVKKAIRLIDDMLAQKNAVKRASFAERNYAAMYPYESIEELIEDGLVKEVSKSSK